MSVEKLSANSERESPVPAKEAVCLIGTFREECEKGYFRTRSLLFLGV
jgi:hypothetical protein